MTLDQCWYLEASMHLKQHLVDMILQVRKMNVLARSDWTVCSGSQAMCLQAVYCIRGFKTVSAIRSKAGEKEKARCYTA